MIDKFEYLGNLKPNDKEKKLPLKIGDGENGEFPLYGPVKEDIGRDALYECRWDHERDIFIKEVEEERIKSEQLWRRRSMKRKKMPEESTFWDMISKLDWDSQEDDLITAPLIQFLGNQKANIINRFEETLTYKLYLLDTKRHTMNIGEASYRNDEEHFSVDYFLYVRCAGQWARVL